MKKSYIYIFVEVAKRELDSRLALATFLIKKGHNVLVGEKNSLLRAILFGKYPPGVILDKCAQIVNHKKFDYLLKKGFLYTVLDEEGLITEMDYFLEKRFNKKAEKYISANFVTGEFQMEHISSKYPNAKNILSGNPRYSMLNNEWDYWFKNEINNIREIYGKFIFVVSSFNPYPKAYDNALPGMKKIDEYYKSVTSKFLKSNLQINNKIIFRPHPSDMPFKLKGLITETNFNIIPWIKCSEYVINAKCTTSLEAYIAKKNSYTWKINTKNFAYKLANLFADDIDKTPVTNNFHKRFWKDKVLNKILHGKNLPFESFNIITREIDKLSFKTDGLPRSVFGLDFILDIKNLIFYFIRGDNYTRVKQKFKKNDLDLSSKKLKSLNIDFKLTGKIIHLIPPK